MVKAPEDFRQFESLLEVVQSLRDPVSGCPWDNEQTHRTLTPYAVEKAHELAEAIENGDHKEMISELGDLLLQVVLHAEIGRGAGTFDIHDVIEAINSKMVSRHPHVFADVKAENSDEVLSNWADIKAKEKAAKGLKPETRFDVPVNLPALTRSSKIGSKTKAYRFDWTKTEDVIAKVEEELAELKEAIAQKKSLEHQESELGDILFSVAQLARHLKIEPEQALRTTNQRFERRFFLMKTLAASNGLDFEKLTTDQLEAYWVKAKAQLNQTSR